MNQVLGLGLDRGDNGRQRMADPGDGKPGKKIEYFFPLLSHTQLPFARLITSGLRL